MIKNRFKDDYTYIPRMDEKGRIVDDINYTNHYYILPFDDGQKQRSNWLNIAFASIFIAIQVVAGMVNQDSSHTFWILYPYIFTLLPVGYIFVGAIYFLGMPTRMQRAQYETSLARMRRSCVGSMVMNGISVILDIIFICLYHDEISVAKELIYILVLIIYIAVGIVFGKIYDKMYGKLYIDKIQTECSVNQDGEE